MICNLESILKLQISKDTFTLFKLFNLLAPFSNEIANLLTISGVANLYPHHAISRTDTLKKSFFDMLALSGIISNSVITGNTYSYNFGLIKGILYLTFAFLIPNIFMHDIVNLDIFKNNKLLSGLLIVYCLELTIQTIFCTILNKNKKS
jgi:hypothetical protein